MEFAFNTGSFVQLDQQEMLEVDGGVGGYIIGKIADYAVEKVTGRSWNQLIQDGVDRVKQIARHFTIIQPAYTDP